MNESSAEFVIEIIRGYGWSMRRRGGKEEGEEARNVLEQSQGTLRLGGSLYESLCERLIESLVGSLLESLVWEICMRETGERFV